MSWYSVNRNHMDEKESKGQQRTPPHRPLYSSKSPVEARAPVCCSVGLQKEIIRDVNRRRTKKGGKQTVLARHSMLMKKMRSLYTGKAWRYG